MPPPAGMQLDIKKTSYKKLSKLLQVFEKKARSLNLGGINSQVLCRELFRHRKSCALTIIGDWFWRLP